MERAGAGGARGRAVGSSSVSEIAAAVAAAVASRSRANAEFFAREAAHIAELCAQMADRFDRGGRLIAIADTLAAQSDARHVAVEFVHPVIVGKRALPAFAMSTHDLERDRSVVAAESDIVMEFDGGGLIVTIGGAEHRFHPPTNDSFVQQELIETLYHMLWELVHVFFEHGSEGEPSDAGNAAFLYPFLARSAYDRDRLHADVAQSVRTKADDIQALREQTLSTDHSEVIAAVVKMLTERLDAGGAVLAFGNGGSATDAMDFVADLRVPPRAMSLEPCRAFDLSENSAILTALANDVGPDVQFARQIIAYGTSRDVAVAFSTSGSSRNIIAALNEARRRGLATIAFTGYDGGQIASERLADEVIVAPSQYVPRIQEAHATAYHVIRSLLRRNRV